MKPGFYADICVFDPATVIDTATFEKPISAAKGIDVVLCNGAVVWRDGKPGGGRAGRALRAPGSAGRSEGLVSTLIAAGALEALVALLRLDGERRDRAGFQALQRDRLAGLFAVAVGALVDRLHRAVDLGDQLAEAIPGAQLEGAVGLGGGAIGEDRAAIQALLLHVLKMSGGSSISSFFHFSSSRKYSCCIGFIKLSRSVGRYLCGNVIDIVGNSTRSDYNVRLGGRRL